MPKKQAQYMPNLFEPITPPSEQSSSQTEKDSRSPAAPKIANPCPRCGARGAATKRNALETGGTHYCSGGCLSDDKTDCFYYTPVVEAFDVQAEKETAKKEVREAIEQEPIIVMKGQRDEEIAASELETEQISAAMPATDLFGVAIEPERAGALAARFLVPPFSVLDARQGYWTQRKAEWIRMGITSEDGRTGSVASYRCDKLANVEIATEPVRPSKKGVLYTGNEVREWGEEYEGGVAWSGATSSIFDPVLCELAYKWFAFANGKILDPFAGGSVRGIVAEKLGYRYTGIELRQEQIEANQVQAEKIGVRPNWICGDSSKMEALVPVPVYEEMFDMVFACPPYYDLEEYSESAADGSAKQTYAEFLIWYKDIFRQCKERLKWNRFLVIVVGEIRDENGFYRNFVGDTISVMLSLGFRYYNEAILVTAVGSLPLRVNAQFGGYRKLGKTHQNILVFYNGSNCDQIQEKFGKLL